MNARLSLLVLLVAGAFGVLLHREQERGTFEQFDRRHREFLRANPGSGSGGGWNAATREPQVVLARLDDPDVPPSQRAFEAWPPLPGEWHVLLQNLTAWQPQAVTVGLPLLVDEPSPGFLKTLAAVPGFTVATDAGAAFSTGYMPPELPPGLPVLRVAGEIAAIPEFETIRPVTLPARVGLQHIDLGRKISVEGEWCLVPLLARTAHQVVPTLALQSILTWSTVPPDRLLVQPGTAITGPGGMSIPIDASGCFRFYLPLSVRAATIQADEFLFTRQQAESTYAANTAERAALNAVPGSLVWFGPDNQAARLHRLPDGNTASSSDLTTRALAAIQTGRFIRPLDSAWQILPQSLAVLYSLWIIRWKRRNLWKGAAAGLLALLTASLLAFQTDHTWIPIAPALLQLALGFTAGWLLPRATPPARPAPGASPV